jgi:hypothetical protein
MYFISAVKPAKKERFNMEIQNSHNAESIIKGLIHEGYEVTINEERAKKVKNEVFNFLEEVALPAEGEF